MAVYAPGGRVYVRYLRNASSLATFVVERYAPAGVGHRRLVTARGKLALLDADRAVVERVLAAVPFAVRIRADYEREVLRQLELARHRLERVIEHFEWMARDTIALHLRERRRRRAPPRTLYGPGATHDDGMYSTVEFGSTR